MNHYENSNIIDQSSDRIDNGLSATLSPEDKIFHYYENGSFTPSRTFSIQEECVFPNPPEDFNQVSAPTSIPQPRQKRQLTQDEVDEDNYNLARPSGWTGYMDICTGYIPDAPDESNNAVRTAQHKDGQQLTQTQVNKKCTMTKHKKIMFIIGVLIVISVAGGVIAYIALGKQGNELIYKGS